MGERIKENKTECCTMLGAIPQIIVSFFYSIRIAVVSIVCNKTNPYEHIFKAVTRDSI